MNTRSRLIPDINFNPVADLETGSSTSPGGTGNAAFWPGGIMPLNYWWTFGKRKGKSSKKTKKSKKSKKSRKFGRKGKGSKKGSKVR